jgi:hypothetical protein
MTTPDPFAPGYRLTDGNQLNDRVANPQWSTTSSLAAKAGGTVLTSSKIVDTVTQITAASAPNAGVVIEQALPGRLLWIVNDAPNTVVVFAEGGSTIDGVPGDVGIYLGAGDSVYFIATDVNTWQSFAALPVGGLNGVVNIITNIAALQAWNKPAANSPEIFALVYNTVLGDGGGLFYLDAADHTTPDNGTTVIVDAQGNRWKRELVQATYIANTPAGNIAATTVQGALNELDTEKVSYAALAASSGSSLVGYTQGGAGAVTETVQTKLRQSVSVDDFGGNGNGVANNTAAFAAAMAASTSVYVPVGTYAIGSYITLPANTKLYGPGTIKAAAGYADNFLVLLSANSTLEVNKLDGTGMPVPVADWTGGGAGLVRSPIGSAVFVNGAVGSSVDNVTIRNVTFTNFPSGPVCTFYAANLLVDGCLALNSQTAVATKPNAVFNIQSSNHVRLVNSHAQNYNVKVFYFGNCYNGLMQGCACTSASIAWPGFSASHYISGGFSHVISGCQSEYSFGVKLTQTSDVAVVGYTSLNPAYGGMIIQSSTDIEISNCLFRLTPTGGADTPYGIGFVAPQTESDVRRVTVSNCNIIYASPGTSINNSGFLFQLVNDSAPPVGLTVNIDDIQINNCTVTSPYVGVKMDPFTGTWTSGTISRVKINNCSIYNPVLYGILSYCASLEVSGCLMQGMGAGVTQPLAALYTQPNDTLAYLRVVNNITRAVDAATVHWDIAQGGSANNGKFATIEFSNNHADYGTYCMRYDGGLAGSTLNTFVVQNNIGSFQSAADAISMTMIPAPGNTFSVCLQGNSLVDSAARRNLKVINSAAITNIVDGGATGNNVNTGQPVYVP